MSRQVERIQDITAGIAFARNEAALVSVFFMTHKQVSCKRKCTVLTPHILFAIQVEDLTLYTH